jgi:hypothetical protein
MVKVGHIAVIDVLCEFEGKKMDLGPTKAVSILFLFMLTDHYHLAQQSIYWC